MHEMNRTVRSSLGWLVKVLLLAPLLATAASAEIIVIGGKTGTYFQIGNNLKDIIAPSLGVRESKGSWANVEELSQTKGVGLAIVQSDVYAAFVYLRDSPQVPREMRRRVCAAAREPARVHAAVPGGDPLPRQEGQPRSNTSTRSRSTHLDGCREAVPTSPH